MRYQPLALFSLSAALALAVAACGTASARPSDPAVFPSSSIAQPAPATGSLLSSSAPEPTPSSRESTIAPNGGVVFGGNTPGVLAAAPTPVSPTASIPFPAPTPTPRFESSALASIPATLTPASSSLPATQEPQASNATPELIGSPKTSFTVSVVPSALASGSTGLWIASAEDWNASWLADGATGMQSVFLGERPAAIVSEGDAAWVVTRGDPTLGRVGTLKKLRPDGATLVNVEIGEGPYAVSVGRDAVWVLRRGQNETASRLLKVSTRGVIAMEVRLGITDPTSLVAVGEGVWVAGKDAVARFDSSGNESHRLNVPGANQVAYDGEYIWVSHAGNGVSKMASSGVIMGTYQLPGTVDLLRAANAEVWAAVSSGNSASLVALDGKGSILQTVRLTGSVRDVAYSGRSVWVAYAGTQKIERVRADIGGHARILAAPGIRALAFDGASMWVANPSNQSVTQYDLRGREIRTIAVAGSPSLLTTGGGGIWVADGAEPKVAKITAGGNVSFVDVAGTPRSLVHDGSRLWVSSVREDGGFVQTVDQWGVVSTITRAYPHPANLAVDGIYVWVALPRQNKVVRLSKEGQESAAYSIGGAPQSITVGTGVTWVLSATGTLTAIEDYGAIRGNYQAGEQPVGLAHDGEFVWVADPASESLRRVDLQGSLTRIVSMTKAERLMAFDGHYLWLGEPETGSLRRVWAR